MAIWLRRLTWFLAVAYPVSLVATWIVFRELGERWWVSAVALFLPRLAFALPIVVLAPALVWLHARRWLWTQVLALLLVLVPLMGFTFPALPHAVRGPHVRVLSFNVNSELSGAEAVAGEIARHSPDIVVLQESAPWSGIATAMRKRYATVVESTQFLLATRLKLLSSSDPPRLSYYGDARSPRFMKYVVETPLGALTLFSVHPVSPRESFWRLRGQGLKHELRSGRLFAGAAAKDIEINAGLRMLQVRTFAAAADKERGPTVILGDTNQPELTATYADELGHHGDAFRQASWGFGYTYPSKHPWMRIDRVLLNGGLRATSFEVGCKGLSDHRCVVAELALAR
jgi:endonuclease/exonuclease/phosphatase (EEP) superfamily protein YafD